MNDDPQASLTLLGALLAALTGVGGLIISARKNNDDAMSRIVNDALAVADHRRDDTHDCLKRLEAQDDKIQSLTVMVERCEEKHLRAEQALRDAGLLH